jgi:ATP-binding cassette subfamily A (ABC1) protein 3
MTVYEHLQYFCLIKGIPSNLIQSTIQFYTDLLSLGPYIDVKAGVLSGGNKRKMCVGMAMIGNPEVVFFDEPSAGVDPISRRFLWKCLTASAKEKNTAMVLTTHSMNEAESLCSEIGILIKGQFVCLDSPKMLK